MSYENELNLLRTNEYAKSFVDEPAYTDYQFTGQVFSGGLNDNYVFVFPSNSPVPDKYILRAPRTNEERGKTIEAIDEEFKSVGATQLGVSYRLRSIPEQANYIYTLYMQGYKVLPYLETESEAMLIPFVEGTSLDKYIQSENFEFKVVENVLNHLTTVHQNGIVFGDRWVKNTFVLPNNDFIELDFDMELVGAHTSVSAFELAQTLYHLIHFSGDNRDLMKNTLISFYKTNPELRKQYDISKVVSFLSGQAEFFHDKNEMTGELYEGLIPPYQEIYELIESFQID